MEMPSDIYGKTCTGDPRLPESQNTKQNRASESHADSDSVLEENSTTTETGRPEDAGGGGGDADSETCIDENGIADCSFSVVPFDIQHDDISLLSVTSDYGECRSVASSSVSVDNVGSFGRRIEIIQENSRWHIIFLWSLYRQCWHVTGLGCNRYFLCWRLILHFMEADHFENLSGSLTENIPSSVFSCGNIEDADTADRESHEEQRAVTCSEGSDEEEIAVKTQVCFGPEENCTMDTEEIAVTEISCSGSEVCFGTEETYISSSVETAVKDISCSGSEVFFGTEETYISSSEETAVKDISCSGSEVCSDAEETYILCSEETEVKDISCSDSEDVLEQTAVKEPIRLNTNEDASSIGQPAICIQFLLSYTIRPDLLTSLNLKTYSQFQFLRLHSFHNYHGPLFAINLARDGWFLISEKRVECFSCHRVHEVDGNKCFSCHMVHDLYRNELAHSGDCLHSQARDPTNIPTGFPSQLTGTASSRHLSGTLITEEGGPVGALDTEQEQSQGGVSNSTQAQSQSDVLNSTRAQSQGGVLNSTQAQSQGGALVSTQAQSQGGALVSTQAQSLRGALDTEQVQSHGGVLNSSQAQSQGGAFERTEEQEPFRDVQKIRGLLKQPLESTMSVNCHNGGNGRHRMANTAGLGSVRPDDVKCCVYPQYHSDVTRKRTFVNGGHYLTDDIGKLVERGLFLTYASENILRCYICGCPQAMNNSSSVQHFGVCCLASESDQHLDSSTEGDVVCQLMNYCKSVANFQILHWGFYLPFTREQFENSPYKSVQRQIYNLSRILSGDSEDQAQAVLDDECLGGEVEIKETTVNCDTKMRTMYLCLINRHSDFTVIREFTPCEVCKAGKKTEVTELCRVLPEAVKWQREYNMASSCDRILDDAMSNLDKGVTIKCLELGCVGKIQEKYYFPEGVIPPFFPMPLTVRDDRKTDSEDKQLFENFSQIPKDLDNLFGHRAKAWAVVVQTEDKQTKEKHMDVILRDPQDDWFCFIGNNASGMYLGNSFSLAFKNMKFSHVFYSLLL